MFPLSPVTEETFESEVLQSPQPVLVDFYTDWCGPCRILAPILERLAVEFDEQIRMVKIDVDENPHIARRFQVVSIPTLILFVEGRIVGRAAGLISESSLRQSLGLFLRDVARQGSGA